MWSAVFLTPADVSFNNVTFYEDDIPAPYHLTQPVNTDVQPNAGPIVETFSGGVAGSLLVCDDDQDRVQDPLLPSNHLFGLPGRSKTSGWHFLTSKGNVLFSTTQTVYTPPSGDAGYIYQKDRSQRCSQELRSPLPRMRLQRLSPSPQMRLSRHLFPASDLSPFWLVLDAR